MSDAALRRTIRRCAAVLAIPLSLVVMVQIALYQVDRSSIYHPVLQFGDEGAVLVLLGAVAYLLGSVAVGLSRSSGREPTRDDSEQDTETDADASV